MKVIGKTIYNHGGRLLHAAACAGETMDSVRNAFHDLELELMGKPIMKHAVRQLDYARDLQAKVDSLVHFLEHAASGKE